MRRKEFLGIVAASCLSIATSGCDNPVNRPTAWPVQVDLPVSVNWKIKETTLVDSTTEVRVPPRTPVYLSGELLPNPGVSLSRHPMGFIAGGDLSIPVIPHPKNINQPYTDKPDDLHISLWLSIAGSGRDPSQQKEVGHGFVNQLVAVDRKKLTFSGGIMSPLSPGTYSLKLFGSFKPEKECSTNRERTSVGTPKFMREITLIVEQPTDPPK